MSYEIKRYERGAEKAREVPYGILRLVGTDVDLEHSQTMLAIPEFTQAQFEENFEVKTARWYVEDGWLVGKNPDMCPGMVVSKADFFGDVMLSATVKLVAPSTHDVNFMIHGEWLDNTNARGNAYVAGLEAFWHGNVGFEKSPEYKLTVATRLLPFDPTREYEFCLGNIDRKIFVLVDGVPCLEITDPEPLDIARYGKIGFEAFASWIMVKDVKVVQLKVDKRKEYYNKEF